MALRDQPYLPLYIQDFLTDEKLIECSAASHGVYIRIMCLMHKSGTYGKILFKQKYKQNDSIIINFANQLAKQLPFHIDIISESLTELIEEGVLFIEDNYLCQKRMIKDGKLSDTRAKAALKGGGNPNLFKQNNSNDNNLVYTNFKTNTENENEIENIIENNNINNKLKFKKEKIEFDFDFIQHKSFINLVSMFIKYRDEVKNKPFTSQIEIECFYRDLLSESKESIYEATKLIDKAIYNQWNGIYQTSNNNSNSKPEKSNTPFEFSEEEQQEILNNLKNN